MTKTLTPRPAARCSAAQPQPAPALVPDGKQYIVHVISGTHWDREWRYTAEQSKIRLSQLIDNLLDLLDREPEYVCFHIDGGAVVLDDYFSVRPENRERLIARIKERRIAVVKWFTLPDTFTVAPEALVRNLLIGQRKCEAVGGAMNAGYTATSYGQTSQLPQIYRGFGIVSALFYRGTNKHTIPPVCRWEGADGTSLYLIRCFDEVTRTNWFFYVHQPLVLGKPARDLSYTYSKADRPVRMADAVMYMSDFQITHEDPAFDASEAALKQAEAYLRKQAYPQAIGPHVMGLDMEDNAIPYSELPRLLRCLNAVSADTHYQQVRLDDYVGAVIEEADAMGERLPVRTGELRAPAVEPGFNGLLGATHSSRMILKLKNEEAETELINVAEPLAAWAAMLGWNYPRALLDRAWENLLLNQPHDNICGAAIDQAHEDMLPRFAAALTVAREISRRACEEIWKKIDLSAFAADDQTLTIFNTLPTARRGPLMVIADLPVTEVATGPVDASAGVGRDNGAGEQPEGYKYFDVVDQHGQPVEHAILAREKITTRVERELDTAVNFPVERVRLLVNTEVPALGYATVAIHPRGPQYVKQLKPGPQRNLIAQPGGRLVNEFLEVQINANGTFRLVDKAHGRVFENLHQFVDNGSVGSAHMHAVPLRDFEVTSLGQPCRIIMEESTPLAGTYRIECTLQVPRAATRDKKDREPDLVAIPIVTRLVLRKGSRRLEIQTRLTNTARDHRLRLLFPTGIKTDHVDVESAFAVERRCILWAPTGDNMEGHYPFQPMQNFIDLSDAQSGLAVLAKGIREYEVIDDDQRTIALSLLRSHRAYMTSTDDMTDEQLERQRGMHALGELEYSYALYPHAGDWQQGRVLQEAYEHKTPLRILQGVTKPGEIAASQTLFTITPADQVALAALCQSEDGQAYILRLWNTTAEPQTVRLASALPIARAAKVRMDETETFSPLEPVARGWQLTLRRHEIATIRLDLQP